MSVEFFFFFFATFGKIGKVMLQTNNACDAEDMLCLWWDTATGTYHSLITEYVSQHGLTSMVYSLSFQISYCRLFTELQWSKIRKRYLHLVPLPSSYWKYIMAYIDVAETVQYCPWLSCKVHCLHEKQLLYRLTPISAGNWNTSWWRPQRLQ